MDKINIILEKLLRPLKIIRIALHGDKVIWIIFNQL